MLAAQEPATDVSPLAEARALYESARYDEALQVIEPAASESTVPLVDQQALRFYRALCFIALDRQSLAEDAIAAMVRAEPLARAENDAPPKFAELYAKVRAGMAKTLMMDAFTRGRDRYRAGQAVDARADLLLALALLDDPSLPLQADPMLADMRVITEGFLALADAPAKADAAREDPVAARPAVSVALEKQNLPVPAAARASSGATRPGYVPPKIVTQPLPAFDTSGAGMFLSRNEGEIEVAVAADGTVASARMTVSLHPRFDALLVATAMSQWRYQPALRLGVPVPATLRVRVRLNRR
jgi:hypothetical protein